MLKAEIKIEHIDLIDIVSLNFRLSDKNNIISDFVTNIVNTCFYLNVLLTVTAAI